MLFNSYEFIFLFFPVVALVFFLVATKSHEAASGWLALASLYFYGWWDIRYVPLLLGSILVNYRLGLILSSPRPQGGIPARGPSRRPWLWLAVGLNLLLLGFFKYSNFFITNLNGVLGSVAQNPIRGWQVVLPLGISFYTFTQIAYLVDCAQGKVSERCFRHYLLFVTYFPHLIAGPVLHHQQMMPQFATPQTYRPNWDRIALGVTLFTMGLAKKLLLADPLGVYADQVFDSTQLGFRPMFCLSWMGLFSYTFQIYFDFSGYTDMAIGLSLFLGIRLPINFASPYQATSIIEFWRRWHISLSTFLREYLYIPLGGNRLGGIRRYTNLLVTMVLGGLWHGAGWTYIIWGTLHGIYLMINHGWRNLFPEKVLGGWLGHLCGWGLTFLAVSLAWLVFRSENLPTAGAMLRGMGGLNGFSLPESWARWFPAVPLHVPVIFEGFWQNTRPAGDFYLLLAKAALIAWFLPSTTKIYQEGIHAQLGWFPLMSRTGGIVVGILFILALGQITTVSRFLYYQF